MWFTETPWPPIFLFAIVAAVLVAVWSVQKRALPLIVASVLAALCVLTYVFERYYVTDAERVEQNVVDLAWAFQKKDRQKTLGYFSPQAGALRAEIDAKLEYIDVQDDLDVKDISVKLVASGSQAIVVFRANATVSVKGWGNVGFKPSRFEVTWQKEAGDWKIVKVKRLDVLQDKELDLGVPKK